MPAKHWNSPDNRLRKDILKFGNFGNKPADCSVCTIEITHLKCPINEISGGIIPSDYISDSIKYPIEVTIGESNTAIDRELDKCLQTMLSDELSLVTIKLSDIEINFFIKLFKFEFNGFIYEWPATKLYELAQNHKQNGNELFNVLRYKDASHRFSRGLKLLLSIPIPVDNAESIESIDGLNIIDITNLKTILYNNLASCYNKEQHYEDAIKLCTQVLSVEPNNLKALYKRGCAYSDIKDYENARKDFTTLLKLDSSNRAVRDKLKSIQTNLTIQQASVDEMFKNMFR